EAADEIVIVDRAPVLVGGAIVDRDTEAVFDEVILPDTVVDDARPAGATGGTAIGVGTVGHFGTGKPSAFVSRRAGAGGRGGGGLGQGGGGGGGGGATKQTESSVMWALRWLKNHQSPDGHWDAAGFDAQCVLDHCGGPGAADQ